MANSVVYTGFDPAFGDRLNELIARAKAEGYAPSLISGVRSAYGWPGMKGQSQADLYGQLGQPGGPRAAAPPGYSPHQYGLAGDVTGIPQSELERLAPEVGLRAIHSDPNHIELANWQQRAATQPAMTAWDQTNPVNVPSQYAMNMEADGPGAQPSRPASGAVKVQPDFLTSLQHYESGGRNIPNTHQGTSSGQAQGYNQITTGTWNEFGGQQYAPDPLHATPEQQNAIAAKIPLRRWDPKTLDYLKGQGFTLDPNKTLGENIAANRGVAPTVPGTTLTSAPTAAAGGPAAPAAGGLAGSLPGYQPNSPGAKMTAKGLQDLASSGQPAGGDDTPRMPPMQMPQAQAVGGPMMIGPGGQNTFGQRLAQQALAQQGAQQGFLTQPSLAAYAPPAPLPGPAVMPAGQATGVPSLPGTTLNSPSQLQMALMSGQLSPYDLYTQQAAYGGGYGSQ